MSPEAYFRNFSRSGFTAVELVVVLAIFVVTASMTLPFIGTFQQSESMESNLLDVVQILRRARHRALSGQQGSSWGVKFQSGSYVLYAGDSYALRSPEFDEGYTLGGSVVFPTANETVFAKYSGRASGAAFVTISHPNGVAKRVKINSAGAVLIVDSYEIVFDNAESVSCSSKGTSCTLPNFTLGSGYGNNRVVVVGVTTEKDGNVTNVTFAGTSCTEIDEHDEDDGTASLWYCLDASLPSAGGDYDIVATTTEEENRNVGVISLQGVAQQPPEVSVTNGDRSSNTISTNITTSTDGAWVVDVIHHGDSGNFTATGTDQVERWDTSANKSTGAGSTRLVPIAGQVTMSWQHTDSSRLAHVLAAFSPALP